MAKLPNLRRINVNDFPEEYKDFVSKLSESLNINLEVLYNTLNKRVTLDENIACTYKTIDITVNTSGTPINPISISFAQELENLYPKGVQVINAVNLTNSNTYPLGQPFVSWELNQSGKLLIKNVTSLQENNKYRLNLIIWN